MPTQFFSSSYRQYKDDTSAFTTWLGRAAETCGYNAKPKKKLSETAARSGSTASEKVKVPVPAAPVVTQRLKGKARKVAKLAQTKTVESIRRGEG